MKKILLALFTILLVQFGANAQCTPDITITDPGIYPDTITNLPAGTAGVFYDTDIQLKVFSDTTISPGLVVTVVDITVDSVGGLPAGFTYSCNPSNCVFPGGSNGCIRLSGTNANPGTYNLTVYVTLHGTLFGFPVDQASTVEGYRIVLDAPVTPVAQFSASSTTICEDGTITFTDQSLNNPTSWFWTFQGGTLPTSTDQNPEVLYTTPGTYDVTLVATNAAGSDTTVQLSVIVVNAKPLAHITPGVCVQICAGESITLLANSGAGLTYQWFWYGNALVGETNQSLSVNGAGLYKVKVTDAATGCTKRSGLRTVEVLPLPVVTVTPDGPTTFCKNLSVILEAASAPGNTYQWTAGGVDIPGATADTYEVTSSEYYRVRVTDPNGCSKLSPGTVVTVLRLPNNSITASGPLSFCLGDSVILSAQPITGNTFQWELNFSSIPGATADSYTAFTSGKYTFTVTGSNGCSRRSAVRKVDVNCRQMAADENLSLGLLAYPNPANEYADIELMIPEKGNVSVQLFDLTGRIVTEIHNGVMEQGYFTLSTDLSNFHPGIYILKMVHGNKMATSRLVIN